MIGNPKDDVVNMRVAATESFRRLPVNNPRKMIYCLSTTEHSHTIASQTLSPKSVEEVSGVINFFLKQNFSS